MIHDYVTRGDEQAFAPPYLQAGCALHGFALAGRRARLQQLVDRFVTTPSRGRVQPRVLGDHVLLYFCEFARSSSLDPIDARRGWLGEREVGLWIPIALPDAGAPTFFVHAMYVDSGPAAISGREVLGLPKQLGHVRVPREPSPRSLLALDVLAQAGAREQPGRWQPLLELERLDDDAGGPRVLLELLGLADALLGAPRRSACELVSLKQFRDALDPRRACYQALVRSRAELLALRRACTTGHHALRLHPLASHDLEAELGLAAAQRVPGFFVECDFDLAPRDQP